MHGIEKSPTAATCEKTSFFSIRRAFAPCQKVRYFHHAGVKRGFSGALLK
jgi:hypothetical protein